MGRRGRGKEGWRLSSRSDVQVGIGRGGGVGGNCYWSSNETIRLTDLDRNEGNPSLLGEEGVRVETVRRSVLPFLCLYLGLVGSTLNYQELRNGPLRS